MVASTVVDGLMIGATAFRRRTSTLLIRINRDKETILLAIYFTIYMLAVAELLAIFESFLLLVAQLRLLSQRLVKFGAFPIVVNADL